WDSPWTQSIRPTSAAVTDFNFVRAHWVACVVFCFRSVCSIADCARVFLLLLRSLRLFLRPSVYTLSVSLYLSLPLCLCLSLSLSLSLSRSLSLLSALRSPCRLRSRLYFMLSHRRVQCLLGLV